MQRPLTRQTQSWLNLQMVKRRLVMRAERKCVTGCSLNFVYHSRFVDVHLWSGTGTASRWGGSTTNCFFPWAPCVFQLEFLCWKHLEPRSRWSIWSIPGEGCEDGKSPGPRSPSPRSPVADSQTPSLSAPPLGGLGGRCRQQHFGGGLPAFVAPWSLGTTGLWAASKADALRRGIGKSKLMWGESPGNIQQNWINHDQKQDNSGRSELGQWFRERERERERESVCVRETS